MSRAGCSAARNPPPSAFIRLVQRDDSAVGQIHAEFRIFLDEPRAVLWVERGPGWFAQQTTPPAPSPRLGATTADRTFSPIGPSTGSSPRHGEQIEEA